MKEKKENKRKIIGILSSYIIIFVSFGLFLQAGHIFSYKVQDEEGGRGSYVGSGEDVSEQRMEERIKERIKNDPDNTWDSEIGDYGEWRRNQKVAERNREIRTRFANENPEYFPPGHPDHEYLTWENQMQWVEWEATNNKSNKTKLKRAYPLSS